MKITFEMKEILRYLEANPPEAVRAAIDADSEYECLTVIDKNYIVTGIRFVIKNANLA